MIRNFALVIPCIVIFGCVQLAYSADRTDLRYQSSPPKALLCSEDSLTTLRIDLSEAQDNMFSLSLTDGLEFTNLKFNPPIALEMSIGDKALILLDPQDSDTTSMIFGNESHRKFLFDQVTLPNMHSGIYLMKISQKTSLNHYTIQSVFINVYIGCSLQEFDDCTSCILNCGNWLITW